MKGSESQKWSVNFIDGYFEYILSLYKKEESPPKWLLMDLLIIISGGNILSKGSCLGRSWLFYM